MIWDIERLRAFIVDGQEENLELDFKASAALAKTDRKKDEISKDVSAFANSAGGVIIYGICEGRDHKAESLDGGVNEADISKEWLESVIISTIHRRIDGVKITPVSNPDAQGMTYYVVEIPQSVRAPHQARDKRFYKRHNFQSVPMEEYEIRDTARRQETPNLEVDFSLINDQVGTLKLSASIFNSAIVPVEYAHISLGLDARLVSQTHSNNLQRSNAHVASTLGSLPVTLFTQSWNIPANMPIYQSVVYDVGMFEFDAPDDGVYLLLAKLNAPYMEEKSIFNLLEVENDKYSLRERSLTMDEVSSQKELPWRSEG